MIISNEKKLGIIGDTREIVLEIGRILCVFEKDYAEKVKKEIPEKSNVAIKEIKNILNRFVEEGFNKDFESICIVLSLEKILNDVCGVKEDERDE